MPLNKVFSRCVNRQAIMLIQQILFKTFLYVTIRELCSSRLHVRLTTIPDVLRNIKINLFVFYQSLSLFSFRVFHETALNRARHDTKLRCNYSPYPAEGSTVHVLRRKPGIPRSTDQQLVEYRSIARELTRLESRPVK